MKFIKRLFKFVLVMVLLVVLLGVVVFVQSRRQPEWYAHVQAADPAQAAEAARVAQNKLALTTSWAAGRQAAEWRQKSGATERVDPGVASPLYTVTFSEQELNAVFQKLAVTKGWDRIYNPYLNNPAVVINDGRVILAGTVKEIDRVVSFHFKPALDKTTGRFRLDLESVMAGKLPMPQALFERYRQQLSTEVAQELPQAQSGAGLMLDGSVNSDAIEAAVGQLVVSVLNRGTVEPVLLLEANRGGTVPVNVVNFAIEGDSVTVGVEMMTPEQRQAWIDRLKGPFGKKPQ